MFTRMKRLELQSPSELVGSAGNDELGMYNNNKQSLKTPFEARFESEDR